MLIVLSSVYLALWKSESESGLLKISFSYSILYSSANNLAYMSSVYLSDLGRFDFSFSCKPQLLSLSLCNSYSKAILFSVSSSSFFPSCVLIPYLVWACIYEFSKAVFLFFLSFFLGMDLDLLLLLALLSVACVLCSVCVLAKFLAFVSFLVLTEVRDLLVVADLGRFDGLIIWSYRYFNSGSLFTYEYG